MRVLGLDVAKSSVSACLLTERPIQPRQFYYECNFFHLKADAAGIRAMLELKPDVAVLEPTGVNYSRLWGTHLARCGVKIFLVGHKELRRYRENHLALPDKDDDADALALACYYFDYFNDVRRFVQIREPITVRIRELILRLAHLNRVQSPIINRLRQDLAWQFPEVALVKSRRGTSNVPALWGWIAGERTSNRYDHLYKNTVGLGLNNAAKYHAQRLCHLQREEQEIEDELALLMADPKFDSYRLVFMHFGFGDRVQAVLLSQIYPLENYLGADGKPEILIRKGRSSGRYTKRYLSLRRFQKALGMAPSEESSGDSRRKKVTGGSAECRRTLWQWVFVRIEVRRNRPQNHIGQSLGEFLDLEKASGRPVRLVRSRVAVRAVKLLFKELVRVVCEQNPRNKDSDV
ncbi:MAG: transposase [Stigonema ocellatum SAG 48.90 = DSM 106950]|nr:transposase [Stigonema ocellatum SAG 48.90 = DSM 106950]